MLIASLGINIYKYPLFLLPCQHEVSKVFMAGIQGETGKFVARFDVATERVSARILITDADRLRELLKPGETISDKIREAIACYLNSSR